MAITLSISRSQDRLENARFAPAITLTISSKNRLRHERIESEIVNVFQTHILVHHMLDEHRGACVVKLCMCDTHVLREKIIAYLLL